MEKHLLCCDSLTLIDENIAVVKALTTTKKELSLWSLLMLQL